MPGDGLQFLGEIKQRSPDLPVIMATAYGDEEPRRRANFDLLDERLHQLSTATDGNNTARSNDR
jgi:CheY-like chemotaxis protein